MSKYILETQCLQDNSWVGFVQEDGCLCVAGDAVFVVGHDDYKVLPGCVFDSEQAVLKAFKCYANTMQAQEKEKQRLHSLSRRYEFRDGEVISHTEPF